MGRSMVALDLGSTGIRAVQFRKRKDRTVVEKIVAEPLPRGVITNGEVKDGVALSEALMACWKQHHLSKYVVLGIANEETDVRVIDADWSEDSIFRANLSVLAEAHLPTGVENTNIDFHTLDEYATPSQDGGDPIGKKRVALVAASQPMVSKFTESIRAAGIYLMKVDLVSFALVHLMTATADPTRPADETAEAVVEIGADVVNIVALQNGQPAFVRTLTDTGGNAITEALHTKVGWTRDEAEQAKRVLGLSSRLPTAASHTAADFVFGVGQQHEPQLAEHPAQPLIDEQAAALIGVIRQTLDFYLTHQTGVHYLSRIVITGGGALMRGLRERIGAEMRCPVEFARPFDTVTLARRVAVDATQDEMFSTAVGLAVGAN